MKKFLCLATITVLFLTACGSKKENSVTCSAEINTEGAEMKTEIIAKFDSNDGLKSANATITFKSSEYANSMCEVYKGAGYKVTCSDTKIKFDSYKDILKTTDIEEVSKDSFITKLKENGYTCE